MCAPDKYDGIYRDLFYSNCDWLPFCLDIFYRESRLC